MFNWNNNEKGISVIGVLFLIFIAILLLSYFGVSIRSIVESPEGRDNVSYIWNAVKNFWNNYLKRPAQYIWNDVIVNIFWKSFISNMERLRDGQPTDFELAAPVVNRNR